MEWTNKKVLELISAYRVLPNLWDQFDANYKNKAKKKEAWESLANAFNCDIKEVVRKIHNLRGQFHREATRLSKYQKYGRETNSKWFAYHPLKFLKNCLRTQKDTSSEHLSESVSIINEEHLGSSEYFQEETTTNNKVDQKKEFQNAKRRIIKDQNSTKLILRRRRSPSKLNGRRSKRRRHQIIAKDSIQTQTDLEDMCLKEVYQTILALKETSTMRTTTPTPHDEHTIYGENIAAKLRKLNNSTASSVLQYVISTAIFEAEMGLYSNIKSPQGLAAQILPLSSNSSSSVQFPANRISDQCFKSSNWDNNSQLSESSI